MFSQLTHSFRRLLSTTTFTTTTRRPRVSVLPALLSVFHLQFASAHIDATLDPTLPLPCNMSAQFNYIPNKRLYVSEPNPYMFGNADNPSNNKHWTNDNWLKSRFHFSFAEYHNPRNSNFGVLRVMNDDLVQPARGFGQHPHRDMEIITYVVRGGLTHQDSMGTSETLGRGSVQFMTAGTGVVHSERNNDPEHDLRFIQSWITPRARGLKPTYGSVADPDPALRRDQWFHMAADTDTKDKDGKSPCIRVNQDVNMYVTELSPGQSLSLDLGPNRQAYALLVEGLGRVNEQPMQQHDGIELFGEGQVQFTASDDGDAHFLVFEMAKDGSTRGNA